MFEGNVIHPFWRQMIATKFAMMLTYTSTEKHITKKTKT
jgi:hypothetical protein